MDSKKDPVVCHKTYSCPVFLFHFFFTSTLHVFIISILHFSSDYLLVRTEKAPNVGHYINDMFFLYHVIVVFVRIDRLRPLNPY